jgi:hypothetical protein
MADMSAIQRCKHLGIANIRGIAYMPGPSNYTKTSGPGSLYENSDFYSNIFEQLWAYTNPNGWGEQGRKDLYRFQQQLGVNFIHCYDWAAPIRQKDQNGKELPAFLQHLTFLKVCAQLGMKATIPISNYTMMLLSQGRDTEARQNFEKIISEIHTGSVPPSNTPVAGPGMWKIFNEYELNFDRKPEHVVTVMSWIAEWESEHQIQDAARLPVMVCTSFGMKDGIEGAGYMKDVWDALLRMGRIGNYDAKQYWSERIVFATNPQREGAAIKDYLGERLPSYWKRHGIPVPPVMFTELGSSIEQTGGERQQAEWLSQQIEASKPGSSNGMMLGACIFLDEERPWEDGAERSFGIMRFGPDSTWGLPKQNYEATTKFPVWDPNGWWWQKDGKYPVEQQVPKLNFRSVASAWGPRQSSLSPALS